MVGVGVGTVIAERLVRARQGETSRLLAIGLTLASAVVACAVAKLPHGILIMYVCCPFSYGAVVLRDGPDETSVAMGPRPRVGVGRHPQLLALPHPPDRVDPGGVADGVGLARLGQGRARLAAAYSIGWVYFVTVESRFLSPIRPREVTGEMVEAVGSLAGTRTLGPKERET